MYTANFTKNNADIKVRSIDGVELDLHRAVLSVNAGSFPFNASAGVSTGTATNANATTPNGTTNHLASTPPNLTNGSSSTSNGSTNASGSTTVPLEVIQLSETAEVLRICFDFVYPKMHPDLEDLTDFNVLLSVANAVGKYGIFAAFNTCNAQLRTFIPTHTMEVFLYTVKYKYTKLMNEVIPHLARSSVIDIIKQVPDNLKIPWVEYHEAWSAIFKRVIKKIQAIPSCTVANQCHTTTSASTVTTSAFGSSSVITTSAPSFLGFGTPFGGSIVSTSTNTNTAHAIAISAHFPGICSACRCSSILWVTALEEIKTVKELKRAVDNVIYMGLGLGSGVVGGITSVSGVANSNTCCGVPSIPSAFAQFLASTPSSTTTTTPASTTTAPTTTTTVPATTATTSLFGKQTSTTTDTPSKFGTVSFGTKPFTVLSNKTNGTPTATADTTKPFVTFSATITSNTPTTDSSKSASSFFATPPPPKTTTTANGASPATQPSTSASSTSTSATAPGPTAIFCGFGAAPSSKPESSTSATTTTSLFPSLTQSSKTTGTGTNPTFPICILPDQAPSSSSSSSSSSSHAVCGHLVNVAKWLKEEIDGVPTFDTFLPSGGSSGNGNGVAFANGNGKSGVVRRVRG